MGYDTLIGHFDYGGAEYSFVTTSELKFEQYMGRWKSRIHVQTGSETVRDILQEIFVHSLKFKIKFDLRKGKIKFVYVHDCQIYRLNPYPFGARAEIEGYMEPSDYMREKVEFT